MPNTNPDNIDVISLDDVLETGVGSNKEPIEPIEPSPEDSKTTPPNNNSDEEDNTPPNPDTGKPTFKTEENKTKILELFQNFNEGSLTDVQAKTKDALLSTYEGKGFDAEGNIIDENGEVVKTFDEVFDGLEDSPKNIDADGNEIDAEGKVVKTAAEIAAEKSYVNKLHLNSDYEFVDEEGKTKIYADSDEGLNEYVEDLANERFRESQQQFVQQNEEAIRIARHLRLGNDISTYNVKTDWAKLKSADLNESEKLAYIKKSFEATGMSEVRVKSMLKMIQDGNSVDSEFSAAIDDLKKHDERVTKEQEIEEAEQLRLHEEKSRTYWKNVETLITEDKIGMVSIPKEERSKFFEYVSKPVDNNGNSADHIKQRSLSNEDKLALSYLRYKNLDLKELVKQQVQHEKVESLTDLVRRSSNIKNESTAPSNTSAASKEPAAISIGDLLS